jgi:hypothetical protein
MRLGYVGRWAMDGNVTGSRVLSGKGKRWLARTEGGHDWPGTGADGVGARDGNVHRAQCFIRK